MLNALTLASSAILGGRTAVSFELALRVGGAAMITAAFTMFVADYAERRTSLVRSARQLNLTEPGRLAATRLGSAALRESLAAMLVAAASSFLGAALPLFLGAIVPGAPWAVLALTIAALGALGAVLGRLVAGRPVWWAAAMLLGGCLVTLIGVGLHIT